MDASTVEAALGLWPQTAGGRATLINHSENHTYRIDALAGRYALRLHRTGYQSSDNIASELAWLDALRGRLPVPRPITGYDGEYLQRIEGRFAVLFAFEPGIEPAEDSSLVQLFRTLGRYAATLHAQAEIWTPPAAFTRQSWTAEAILDPDGLWGDWRRAPGVDAATRETLNDVDRRLRDHLAAYGQTRDRFGLIHADMRLANLLVDGSGVTLIDFDDCGFGWFVYDLAASLSFIETRTDLQNLIDAWCAGYATVRHLADQDIAIIAPMILLRRMALLAWIASHSETDLAQKHAPRFAADTVALATGLLR